MCTAVGPRRPISPNKTTLITVLCMYHVVFGQLLKETGHGARIIVSKYPKITHCNRPFPSSKKSHFQNKAKCETFVVKMSFICIIIENHFHINGFALSLVLKVRFFGIRKWPINYVTA